MEMKERNIYCEYKERWQDEVSESPAGNHYGHFLGWTVIWGFPVVGLKFANHSGPNKVISRKIGAEGELEGRRKLPGGKKSGPRRVYGVSERSRIG